MQVYSEMEYEITEPDGLKRRFSEHPDEELFVGCHAIVEYPDDPHIVRVLAPRPQFTAGGMVPAYPLMSVETGNIISSVPATTDANGNPGGIERMNQNAGVSLLKTVEVTRPMPN